ncbi:hypothetical protein [Staphylococcus phage vB_StaM_SA1]|nr:hypothetical protein [Staphylococcus phage vB_StaM_SA1]
MGKETFLIKEDDRLIDNDIDFVSRCQYTSYILSNIFFEKFKKDIYYTRLTQFFDDMYLSSKFGFYDEDRELNIFSQHIFEQFLFKTSNSDNQFGQFRVDINFQPVEETFMLKIYFESDTEEELFDKFTDGYLGKYNVLNQGKSPNIYYKDKERLIQELKELNEYTKQIGHYDPKIDHTKIVDYLIEEKEYIIMNLIYQIHYIPLMTLYELSSMHDIEFFIEFNNGWSIELINIKDIIEKDVNKLFMRFKTEKDARNYKVKKGFS